MAVAALAVRRVLTRAARDRGPLERGGALQREPLSGHAPVQDTEEWDLLVLEGLAGVKERSARIAELRYFAGLSIEEVARVLGIGTTIIPGAALAAGGAGESASPPSSPGARTRRLGCQAGSLLPMGTGLPAASRTEHPAKTP